MKLINSFECNKMFELHLYYNSIFYLFSVQPAGIPPIYLLALKTQIPFHCHYCSHFGITYLLSIKVEKMHYLMMSHVIEQGLYIQCYIRTPRPIFPSLWHTNVRKLASAGCIEQRLSHNIYYIIHCAFDYNIYMIFRS